MPYKNIHNPTKGIVTAIAPTDLEPEMTPYAKGVYLRDGEVVSDYGHTQFPVAGADQTNLLNGTFMRADQYFKADGTSYLVALTTKHAYQYNTSTTTWDCITRGTLVEDCEDAWTASANVTATADGTIKLRGTNSAKMAIAAGFTTGVAAYENFSSADLTGNTALHFWVYSTIALSANDYALRLSEQNAGGTGATYVDFNIPAISANTWTPVSVDGDFSALDATLSVSLVVNVDKGAMSIYIDDVRATVRFTGDEDNIFSIAQLNDTAIITNGVDQPQKYTFVLATGLQSLTTTLNTGTISTSEVVVSFKDHILFMNNTENGADAPQRVSWGNIGAIEDYVNGTAGYQDLTGDSDWIIAAKQLGENEYIIYKERSIVKMEWVGGQTPFRFTVMYSGDGIVGKNAVEIAQGDHVVIGSRYVYVYDGGKEIFPIDDNWGNSFYTSIDFAYINRSFILYDKSNDEIQIWVPTASAYPDDIWVMNTVTKAWYRKDRTMTGFGHYITQQSITIGDLVGTIGDQNLRIGDYLGKGNAPMVLVGNNSGEVFKIDTLTLNNDGDAITNEFQTPDFLSPANPDDLDTFFRVKQLIYEAKGQSITTEWSDDGGSSWNPTSSPGNNTVSLDSIYKFYQQDFDTTSRKIRFRFKNTTASSGFSLRFFGFYWQKRSSRR